MRTCAFVDRHALCASGEREGRGLRLPRPVARRVARACAARSRKTRRPIRRTGPRPPARRHYIRHSRGTCRRSSRAARAGRHRAVPHGAARSGEALRDRCAKAERSGGKSDAHSCAPEQARQRRTVLAALATQTCIRVSAVTRTLCQTGLSPLPFGFGGSGGSVQLTMR